MNILELSKGEMGLRQAFFHVFNSPDGKVVLDHLRQRYGEAIIPEGDVSSSIFAALGKRNMYYEIIQMIGDQTDVT